uniref:Uncharacterized protein n=1 Tax=Anguilla anguilla TaxID=7936 RepID=A0A0E9QX91_ANGAN
MPLILREELATFQPVTRTDWFHSPLHTSTPVSRGSRSCPL